MTLRVCLVNLTLNRSDNLYIVAWVSSGGHVQWSRLKFPRFSFNPRKVLAFVARGFVRRAGKQAKIKWVKNKIVSHSSLPKQLETLLLSPTAHLLCSSARTNSPCYVGLPQYTTSGGLFNNVLRPPRSNALPFYIPLFEGKRYPFRISFREKWHSFHIYLARSEPCIPFNWYKFTVSLNHEEVFLCRSHALNASVSRLFGLFLGPKWQISLSFYIF